MIVFRTNSRARSVITFVIIFLIILVFLSVFAAVNLRPENRIKSEFENLARDYYENIFYENMLSAENYSGNPEKSLAPFRERGLAKISLRQISLSDLSVSDFLLERCESGSTFVRFYPDPPYGRADYHAEYTYSCNF